MTKFDEVQKFLLTKPCTWLITGVAGFIGANLLRHLLQLNQIVIGIDNFATGFKKNLDDILNCLSAQQQNNFHFYQGDICSMSDCEKVMTGVDYVLHQAALGSVPRSIKLPEETHLTNTTGFLNILTAAKNFSVKRLVYASSSAVYGDSKDSPKVENRIGKPLSPYAVSKYTNELYAHAFNNCYQFETIGLRYFNVFGPHQNSESVYAAVIPLWIKNIFNNEKIYINGDGSTSRDFCYVDNVVQANILAALTDSSNAVSSVYNIAVGEKTTLNDLFAMIIKIMNKPVYDNFSRREFRPGDVLHSLADIQQAKTTLGYEPTHRLSEGLSLMLNWYKNLNLL